MDAEQRRPILAFAVLAVGVGVFISQSLASAGDESAVADQSSALIVVNGSGADGDVAPSARERLAAGTLAGLLPGLVVAAEHADEAPRPGAHAPRATHAPRAKGAKRKTSSRGKGSATSGPAATPSVAPAPPAAPAAPSGSRSRGQDATSARPGSTPSQAYRSERNRGKPGRGAGKHDHSAEKHSHRSERGKHSHRTERGKHSPRTDRGQHSHRGHDRGRGRGRR